MLYSFIGIKWNVFFMKNAFFLFVIERTKFIFSRSRRYVRFNSPSVFWVNLFIVWGPGAGTGLFGTIPTRYTWRFAWNRLFIVSTKRPVAFHMQNGGARDLQIHSNPTYTGTLLTKTLILYDIIFMRLNREMKNSF